MKCSIIIPYYKRREHLENTLRTLNQQDFDANEFEVLLIEDGSDDFNQEIIDKMGLNINVRYFNTTKNVGRSYARNFGISHAKGELLVFMDSDMLVKSDYISQHLNFHNRVFPESMVLQVGLRNLLYDKSYENLPNRLQMLAFKKDYDHEDRHGLFQLVSENLGSLRSSWLYTYTNNLSIPKKAVELFGGFDENFKGWGLEDTEFGYRLSKNGVKIMYNPNIEAFHQYHDEQFTREKEKQWDKNLKYFMHKYEKDFPVNLLRMLPESDIKYQDMFAMPEEAMREETRKIHMNYEKSLRMVYDLSERKFEKTLTVKDISIEILSDMVSSNPNTRYVVICSKNKLDLIIWIQNYMTNSQVLLFTYS
ncbi:MAG TPA: glycosyltransferase [Ruminiclostridium sp.]|nr:glycosyltransferase [Ruminiclostridium sp.]